MQNQDLAENPLAPDLLHKIDAYFRAASYLSVGQIYLYANPLLCEPPLRKHIKLRLLGHFGTTPGLNFIYVNMNRIIKTHDRGVLYLTGPGHGGPALVANTYLEGTYNEVYPDITQDAEGIVSSALWVRRVQILLPYHGQVLPCAYFHFLQLAPAFSSLLRSC